MSQSLNLKMRAKQMVDRIKEMRNKYFNGKKQQEDSENDLSDIMSSSLLKTSICYLGF